VLYNASTEKNNVTDRILWTKTHELGHVVLNHLPIAALPQMEQNAFSNLQHPDLEAEADWFSANLLSPIPLYENLYIESPEDIRCVFGLSGEASINRWNAYCQWKQRHTKTTWENDIRHIYLSKSQ
jgi:hypothetical protein